METSKNLLCKSHLSLQALRKIAFATSTLAANSRCAFIFHNPKKPDSLEQLRKF